jgi:hypothetical protein
MAAIFSFRCDECGKMHEGSPSIGFRAPDPYLEQPREVQDAGKLTSDFCQYTDDDGRHFFIRTCLEIPIHGVGEPFLWGVWSSLSQKNYERYSETYDDPDPADSYFGWFSNYLPYYTETYALKCQVRPQRGGNRPLLELEKTDHPLSRDYHEGITIARAQEIAAVAMHR